MTRSKREVHEQRNTRFHRTLINRVPCEMLLL